MFCDNKLSSSSSSSSSYQELTGLPKSRFVEEAINFIEKNIEKFKNQNDLTEKEKGLNQQFVICMNSQIKDEPFFFHHEYIEDILRGNSAQVDIGVIIRDEQKAFFVLEAKRLTVTSLSKEREKEYVVGRFNKINYIDSGAIERFKKEIHGVGLSNVGIIGYIQTDNYDTWFYKINSWIEEQVRFPQSNLTWSNNEQLYQSSSNKIFATYSSVHQCKTKKISMYHIWVNLIK